MKKLSLFLAWLFAASAAWAQPDLVARVHFLGGDRIATDPQSRAFTNEFCSPEARAFESHLLDKVAQVIAPVFKPASGTNDAAPLLRPLLDDLLRSEWLFEVRDNAGAPEFALAIQLSPEREESWVKTVAMVFHATDSNWLSLSATNRYKLTRWNDWVIVDCGQHQLSLEEEITKDLQKPAQKNASTHWLEADLDWPRLSQRFPSLREFNLPKFAFTAIGRDGNLQFNGKLNLSEPLPALPAWRVPTNAIHYPFTSFTAARGVGPWLAKQSWFQTYAPHPQSDQVFVWSLPQLPFQTFAAEPVPNAHAALAQIHDRLTADMSWTNQFNTAITLNFTDDRLVFAGMPIAPPFIEAHHETAGDFLLGGFFPNTPKSKPLPPDLVERFNEPNLVYYHWETTADRLQQLPELSQLVLAMTKHQQLDGESATAKWIVQVRKITGNNLTQVTRTSPTELAFTRKSPVGLTAIEFLALASWIESPKFPAFDLRAPERRMRIRRAGAPAVAPMPAPGIPAPAPAAPAPKP